MATYNRPAMLQRQLDYIGRYPLRGPVLVLDSSRDEVAKANASHAAAIPGMEYLQFPSSMPVFTKFSAGLERVETPFCMILPDDDFVWLDTVPEMVAALDSDRDAVVSHGLYFEFFSQDGEIHVTELIQGAAAHVAGSASQRVVSLMTEYEALTYALYRSDAARRSFDLAKRQESVLAQELLGGAAAVAQGKVLRLPTLTHGRRAGSTLGYRNWHPLEWSAVSPQGLFDAYRPYRESLLDLVRSLEPAADDIALARRIDLAHLAYLAAYLSPEVLRSAARADLDENNEISIMETAWDIWAGERGPAWARPFRRGGQLTRWMRRKIRETGARYWVAALKSRFETSRGAASEGAVRFNPRFTRQMATLSEIPSFDRYRRPLAMALTLYEAEQAALRSSRTEAIE